MVLIKTEPINTEKESVTVDLEHQMKKLEMSSEKRITEFSNAAKRQLSEVEALLQDCDLHKHG